MSHLDDLIIRLKSATEPMRELDVALWAASGTMPEGLQDIGYYVDPGMGCIDGQVYAAPSYTKSVDAALTLYDGNHALLLHAATYQVTVGDISNKLLPITICLAWANMMRARLEKRDE